MVAKDKEIIEKIKSIKNTPLSIGGTMLIFRLLR